MPLSKSACFKLTWMMPCCLQFGQMACSYPGFFETAVEKDKNPTKRYDFIELPGVDASQSGPNLARIFKFGARFEIWMLNRTGYVTFLQFEGYIVARSSRLPRRGGGCALLYSNQIQNVCRIDLSKFCQDKLNEVFGVRWLIGSDKVAYIQVIPKWRLRMVPWCSL